MSNESYVLVGTPLPEIKTTDAFGEPKRVNPTRDLEVRDEQGRRRFHGAFTGGFSAGYYNTVGSKEGWTPSEFVSSRDRRSERKTMKPEDFMDEEDKQMLADSTRLTATSDFDTIGSTRRDLERKRAAAMAMQTSGSVLGALPDTLIDDIIVPSSEPVGIRLLKRMGWKPGQGIGPRVSRRQRKPGDGLESDEDDEHLANVTFAPIDSAVVVFTNKTNHQGLGFDPYKHAPEFDRSLQSRAESSYLASESKAKKTGFGFGTFDDDDDDEDDVYGSGPKPLRSMDYDMSLNDRPRSKRDDRRENEKSTMPDTHATKLCSDGRPPLHGFVLAITPVNPTKWYSGPKVPKDFVPHHTFDDDVKPTLPESKHEQPRLTADDRALVLGETPIDGPRRSVFEYISAENKNRLDNLLGFVMDTDGEKRLRKDHWEVPKLEKQAAEAALQGFMPFGDNIPKQNRYKQYLNVQAGISNEKIELVEGFSGQDMMKEFSEFVQAARIFKPMTSTMANRFTSATKTNDSALLEGGLRSAEDIKATEKTAPIHRPVERMEVPKSQAAKAAAMGMFGPLTRTIVDFYPAKLLCKRFNVPNPHPDHKESEPEAPKDLLDKDTMDNMIMNRKPGDGITEVSSRKINDDTSSPSTEMPADVVAEEEPLQQPEEVQERPPMDIFKAIFDNSDTESESESDAEDTRKVTAPNTQAQETPDSTSGIEKTTETRMDQEVQKEPFRPVFTRKTDRVGSSSLDPTSRIQSRSSKFDLSHLKDEDEDEAEIGPKLTMPNNAAKVTKKPNNNASHADSDKKQATLSEKNESSDSDDFIGPRPPTPEKPGQEDSGSEEESRSSKRHKPSQSPHRESRSSSSRHKSSSSSSRHKSSSSRSDRRDRYHDSSSSRRRSTSRSKRRSRHHDSSDEESQASDGADQIDGSTEDRERKRHSGHSSSSKSKSKWHRGSRSRSRSPSKRSHKRDKDRDQDRDRRSKRSRSDRHKSKHHDHDRGNKDLEDDDMDGLWVEKEVDIPTPTKQPTPEPQQPVAPPPNRPRATSFF